MYFSNSELQLQSAVQRALRAEEDLQASLSKIQDLERQLQGQPGAAAAAGQSAEGPNTMRFSKMKKKTNPEEQ